VEINAMQLAFLDIPSNRTREYNRWYDLDHKAEHVAKADVLMANRYVAPKSLRGLPGTLEHEPWGGHARYLTIYSFGGPLDFQSAEARQGWLDTDKGILRQGRFWMEGRPHGLYSFRVGQMATRTSLLVQDRAVPYVAHRGVILATGTAPSAERRQEAVDWWLQVHLVDLFGGVPGLLAAIELVPVEEESDEVAWLLLCEDPPAEVLAGIEEVKRYATAVRRFPAYQDAYVPKAFVPFDRIVPLEYDFEFGDEG
jgi:hypothetical protein